MDQRKRVKLSKLLSFILRHNPSLLGISLDSEGFADVSIEELALRIRKLRGYEWVTSEHILEVVELDEKGRFEVKDRKIRATYGHSVEVKPKYPEVQETPKLYHGTTRRAEKVPPRYLRVVPPEALLKGHNNVKRKHRKMEGRR